ncbi:MAG TPA: GNAT family N-acetyltransferase [Puia sp.]|jgi:GNAT superfamily N-acetyltransferase|nr:GNAT family N-acetyltransferase [Puia sp.]
MIRRAQLSDAEAIRTLIALLDYDPPATLEEKIRRLSMHPDEILLVYELNAEVVAFLSLHFIPQIAVDGDFARISYFAVKDSARSLGIGGQLEAHAARLARERNCDRIEVHCHTRRTDAHRFYERQGYVESPKYFIKRLNERE